MLTPIHGGDISGFARRAGKNEKDILDFSSNINPLGPPASLLPIYNQTFSMIARYPDPLAKELCCAIARHHNIDARNIIAGNGAMALIELAIRTLRPQKALLIEPCFTEYRRLLQLYGTQVCSIILSEDEQFNIPLREILSSLDGIDMIILGHPNNPTGTMLNQSDLFELMKETHKRDISLVLDEAFVDWCLHHSVISNVARHPSVIVIRSLTKFFALAGIRCGFTAASQPLIDKMRTMQETWSCNIVAQELGVAALEDGEYIEKIKGWFQEESQFLSQQLSQIAEVKIFFSHANFLLGKILDKKNVQKFWDLMQSYGIYLREVSDFTSLDHRYFRVAIKIREDNCILIKVMKEVFAL